MPDSKFNVGQIVRHRRFGYRGVVFDADPQFSGNDEWYERMARSRPPKEKPWYHVLVDGAEHTTYVAEQNLEPDLQGDPVTHPALDELFSDYRDAAYVPRRRDN